MRVPVYTEKDIVLANIKNIKEEYDLIESLPVLTAGVKESALAPLRKRLELLLTTLVVILTK